MTESKKRFSLNSINANRIWHKKIRVQLWLLVFVTIFSLQIINVSAHELQTNGSISALLHIEPNDNPVEFIPQQFVLTFTDSSNQFDLNVCDCNINLTKGNQIINLTLSPTNNLASLNKYTFNDSGNYQLTVSGIPKTTGTFQSFSLLYKVSVKKNNSDPIIKRQSSKSRVLIVAGLVILQTFTALGLYGLFSKKKF